MMRPETARLDNRSRGNAAQQLERYKSLARDATQVGDRITAEYYLQYADHYFRVLNENRPRQEERPQQGRDWQERDSYQDIGEADDPRDDDRGQGNGSAYRDRADGDRESRGEQGYERDYRDDAQVRFREERPQARADLPRQDRQRDDRPRDGRQSNERPRDDRAQGDRSQADRVREDRSREDRPRDDRPRDDRPREDRQANREQRPRRDRWNGQQGGAEPSDPPVPAREPVAAREQVAASAEGETAAAPRRGRPRRAEVASDDPFAVRRAPEPAGLEVRPEEPAVQAAEPSEQPAAPVRRRRAPKAGPDKDAELSLENA